VEFVAGGEGSPEAIDDDGLGGSGRSGMDGGDEKGVEPEPMKIADRGRDLGASAGRGVIGRKVSDKIHQEQEDEENNEDDDAATVVFGGEDSREDVRTKRPTAPALRSTLFRLVSRVLQPAAFCPLSSRAVNFCLFRVLELCCWAQSLSCWGDRI